MAHTRVHLALWWVRDEQVNHVTKDQVAQFKAWVETDWPKDRMLQEVHLARLIRQAEMKGMSDEEIVAYYSLVPKRQSAA